MFSFKSLSVVGLALISLATLPFAATNGTYETGKVNESRTIVGQNQVGFSLGSERIHNGCSGDDGFYFDASTTSGKIMWAALLSAKASGKNVNIWINSQKSKDDVAPCTNYQWNITILDIAP